MLLDAAGVAIKNHSIHFRRWPVCTQPTRVAYFMCLPPGTPVLDKAHRHLIRIPAQPNGNLPTASLPAKYPVFNVNTAEANALFKWLAAQVVSISSKREATVLFLDNSKAVLIRELLLSGNRRAAIIIKQDQSKPQVSVELQCRTG
jgi:hypothetical protein